MMSPLHIYTQGLKNKTNYAFEFFKNGSKSLTEVKAIKNVLD